ncbi:ribosomal protein S18-alanine N-acetyltransferase [Candidatus Aerophobetes bacterium]|nr:ribosomal protein S18-alanine N-acetyltransferase [Candidatus Aerophobetes bacterium]
MKSWKNSFEGKIEIRRMKREDLIEVSQIEKLSFPTPWSFHVFSSELNKKGFAFYYVTEYGERVVGYAGYWKIAKEAHIVNLAIHPSFRKRGIGTKLLRYLFQEARGQGLAEVTLEVRYSNIAAQRLYDKFGFKKVAIHRHYYIDEDAIIYWKKM